MEKELRFIGFKEAKTIVNSSHIVFFEQVEISNNKSIVFHMDNGSDIVVQDVDGSRYDNLVTFLMGD